MARLLRRRVLIPGLAAVVIASVVLLAVAANGEPSSALRLLSGDAWLENSAQGTVSHVGGYSGQVDAQASVGQPGDPFEVVQRDGGAYVLDLRSGKLSAIDDTTTAVTAAAKENGPASALQVITGTNATWVLDRSSGILRQLNPTTLAPIGRQIPLGGPTGAATIDQDGAAWVPMLSGGVVVQVDPGGALTRHPFGHSGDPVQVADTGGGVWAVDPDTGTAASLSVPGVHPVALPAMSAAPVVGSSGSTPDLVLVAGSRVLDVNTSQASVASVSVPDAARATQVAVTSGRAYLLDPPAHHLDAIDLSPMAVFPSIPVPQGADQLVSKDQLLFVNSSSTPQALVVGPKGAVTDVSKYSLPLPSRPGRSGTSTAKGSPSGPAQTRGAVPTPSAIPPGATPAAPVLPAPNPTTTVPAPPAPAPPAPAPPTPAPPTTAPPGVPGAPTITHVTTGNGVLTVSWSPPASDGGSPLTRYEVTGSPTPSRAAVGAATTTATLTGLADGVRECVQVQAVNRVGGGPLSPAGQACATPQKNSPGRVGAVTARESSPGSVILSWTQPPLGPYGTPIKSYTVTGGPAPTTVTTTRAVISGLANGTQYSFTLTATNSAGVRGPASAPVTAITWSQPGAVSNLKVTAGDDQLTISWGAASVRSGSPKVKAYSYTVAGTTRTTTSTSASVKVPAWKDEAVKVHAVNAVGSGPTSTASGTAWTRSSTVTCFDSLSGDRSVQNNCTNTGGAWSQQSSSITWIDPDGHTAQLSASFEYLCTTYESNPAYGDVYAIVGSPGGCKAALASVAQSPDVGHVVAAVSTSSLGSGSQKLCEWKGTTTGTGPAHTYSEEELGSCGSAPSGMSKASKVTSFYI